MADDGPVKRLAVATALAISLVACSHPAPAASGWTHADRVAFLQDKAQAGATVQVAECQLRNAERIFRDWSRAQFATMEQLAAEDHGCVAGF